jgi:hypothetical protein
VLIRRIAAVIPKITVPVLSLDPGTGSLIPVSFTLAKRHSQYERHLPQNLESRWGRHFRWQLDHSSHQPINRERPFERVSAAPVVVHGREFQRTDQQRSKHRAAVLDVPRQQPAPVGELRPQTPLQAYEVHVWVIGTLAAECHTTCPKAWEESDGRAGFQVYQTEILALPLLL